MRVVARRLAGLRHEVAVRGHRLVVDELPELGGTDAGPSPQELLAAAVAACAAGSISGCARLAGWSIDTGEVEASYAVADRGAPTILRLLVRLPATLPGEQVERLTAAALTGPVCRSVLGAVAFDQIVERS